MAAAGSCETIEAKWKTRERVQREKIKRDRRNLRRCRVFLPSAINVSQEQERVRTRGRKVPVLTDSHAEYIEEGTKPLHGK